MWECFYVYFIFLFKKERAFPQISARPAPSKDILARAKGKSLALENPDKICIL